MTTAAVTPSAAPEDEEEEEEDEDLKMLQAGWPLDKLRAALARAPAGAACAVVVTTGAMNPVHRGHVAMMHQAQEALAKHGIHAVGLFVSPSHDGYVQPKCAHLRTLGLSAAFRLALARAAVAEDPLVDVGAWEAQYPGMWPDFPVVVTQLQKYLEEALPEAKQLLGSKNRARVYYACGTDHAKKCHLYAGMRQPDVGVVVVPRANEAVDRPAAGRNVIVAEPASGEVAALNSTLLRRQLRDRDYEAVRRGISEAAARLLLDPQPQELQEFGADFEKLGLTGELPVAAGGPAAAAAGAGAEPK